MQVKQARKAPVRGRMTAVNRMPSKYNCFPNDCNKNRIQSHCVWLEQLKKKTQEFHFPQEKMSSLVKNPKWGAMASSTEAYSSGIRKHFTKNRSSWSFVCGLQGVINRCHWLFLQFSCTLWGPGQELSEKALHSRCIHRSAIDLLQMRLSKLVSNSLTFELFDIQDYFSHCLLLLWEKTNPI